MRVCVARMPGSSGCRGPGAWAVCVCPCLCALPPGPALAPPCHPILCVLGPIQPQLW